MRKRILTQESSATPDSGQSWLNLEKLADVELTSEDDAYPIESALLTGENIASTGWRASAPGKQTIRLTFADPVPLQRILLEFREASVERTQEYILRWSEDWGRSYRELVRQQWNFSPSGATIETEEHQVEIPSVTVLELVITPEISGGPAVASLQSMRLA